MPFFLFYDFVTKKFRLTFWGWVGLGVLTYHGVAKFFQKKDSKSKLYFSGGSDTAPAASPFNEVNLPLPLEEPAGLLGKKIKKNY